MKKLIILLSCFILTGCFENSGYLVKSCTKEENANTLKTITTYTFGFKNDIIEDIKISYDNIDSDVNTISSIKLSLESQNNYSNLKYNVITDTENQYKIEYDIPLDSDDELLDKFNIKKSRTELVKNLKELGYTCE